jgi:hypothetical protein
MPVDMGTIGFADRLRLRRITVDWDTSQADDFRTRSG